MRTLVLVFLFAATPVFAQDKACTPAEAANAEKAIDRVVNWDQLYKVYKEFRHCDQGPVAEVYTEALLRCLVEWKKVDGLANPMTQDKEYNAFVMRHLRSAGPEDQKSVYSRAKMSCPKGLDDWCTSLTDASKPLTPFKGIEVAPMPTFNEPKK
jgi:hypothetical protein